MCLSLSVGFIIDLSSRDTHSRPEFGQQMLVRNPESSGDSLPKEKCPFKLPADCATEFADRPNHSHGLTFLGVHEKRVSDDNSLLHSGCCGW
jgi:hypothetical protein